MNKNISVLKEKFENIKESGLCKSLRNGTTGIGFTFESLIGKKEDNSPEADFNGIEIKVKLGYTKFPITLFSLTPKGYNYTIKYLLETYGYPDKTNKNFKCFRGKAFCNKTYITANKYILKLKINRESNKLELVILDINLNVLDKTIYWNLNDLAERLYKKLNYLAYVKGYPYKLNSETYYKYTSINFYKLKNFDIFLDLIKEDKIHVCFNIGTCKSARNYGKIEDRGTAFKLDNSCIKELFDTIK